MKGRKYSGVPFRPFSLSGRQKVTSSMSSSGIRSEGSSAGRLITVAAPGTAKVPASSRVGDRTGLGLIVVAQIQHGAKARVDR